MQKTYFTASLGAENLRAFLSLSLCSKSLSTAELPE